MKKNLTYLSFFGDWEKNRQWLMRLTVLKLVLVMSFMTSYGRVNSQMIISKLKLESVELSKALEQVENLTEYDFVFSYDDVEGYKVTVDLESKTLEESMSEILKDLPFKYRTEDDVVIVFYKEPIKNVQQDNTIEIKGKVVDEKGEALPGVTVVVKSLHTGASTDLDGLFRIKATKGQILVFSMIGMETVELVVSSKTELNVVLKEQVSDIDEVIVTGIFNRHAESFTGSVVTVKAEDLQRVSNSNIFESLKNLDPSLNLIANLDLGSDPNRVPDLQLRGTSSFPTEDSGDLRSTYQGSSNQPLFILDGFEASATTIFDLDMERVSSLTILKDAAAKAIYGSKAGNGVVVIETRKPEAGTLRVRYTGKLSIEAADLSSYNLCNALEKLEVEKIAGDYDHSQIWGILEKEALYNERYKKSIEGDDTDWLALPLQIGVGTKHGLSLELGEKKIKVSANLSYNDIKGVMKESSRTNIAGSVGVDYRYENLLFRNTMSVTSNKSEDSPYGTFSDYARMNPYWAAYNADGTLASAVSNSVFTDGYSNPLYNATINTSLTDSYFEFINNSYVEWTIKEGIRLTGRVGVSKKTSESNRFYPANHTKFDNYSESDFLRKGSYQLNNGNSFNVTGDLNLNYSKMINDKHYVMANVGFNIGSKTSKEIVQYAEGFPSDRMDDITFALQYAENKTPYGSESTVRDMGFLGVVSYAYDSRYLIDLTVRSNASSLFGANKRWGTFSSLGLGWNVHHEAFLENSEWLKKLKVRASLGTSGTQKFSSYQSLSTYKYYLDRTNNGTLGAYPLGLANEDLQWQTKLDYNVGIDAQIGRLSVVFDYYESITENLITNLTLPYSTGFSTIKENIGKVKNKGVELAINWQVLKSKDGFLNLTFAGTTNTNEIIGLSDAMKEFNATQDELAGQSNYGKPVLKYVEGGSMNSIWAVPSLGIDPATGREIYVKQDGTETYTWDAKDQVVVGNSLAKYRGNIGFNGEFKGIGFSVVSTFSTGYEMYNSTLVNKVENIDTYWNVDKRVFDGRWTTPGDIVPYKNLGDTYVENGVRYSNPKTKATSRFVQSRRELDISSLSLYYNLKREWAHKIYMENMKISLYMNNVYTFSSIQVERGTSYPFARTMSLSLRATF